MPKELKRVLHHLSKLAAVSTFGSLSDHELLGRFLVSHDEIAFTALAERHGPMVLGVCRRVLRDAHHAEDACQATFLVLARKAASIHKRASLGSWLHGVAFRIARKLRASLARRAAQSLPLDERPQSEDGEALSWRELQGVLDAELQRIPAKYRAPLVLCYLEGKTRDEAAAQLGWSDGELRGRLERGRHLLRRRLQQRGLALAGPLCATMFAPGGASAAVPAHLVIPTVKAAMSIVANGSLTAGLVPASVIALAKGGLSTMFLTKLTVLIALVVGLTAGLASGLPSHQALADGPKADSGRVAQANEPAIKLKALNVALVQDATVKDGSVIEMIGMPAGEFMMGGAPGDEFASPTEEARRKVRLTRPFYLSKYEITDRQWRLVMGKAPNPDTANLPAAAMTWAEAREFTAKLNKSYASVLPEGSVFRLPTEAEWEYAARAGATTRFYFGDDGTPLKDYAWFRDNAQHTMPVGQKKPNAWGFHDMTGNVWEMCLDYFLPNAKTDAEVVIDPINLKPHYSVVTRGGSYIESNKESRLSAHSSTHYIPKKRPNVGFRLAIGPPMPAGPIEAPAEEKK